MPFTVTPYGLYNQHRTKGHAVRLTSRVNPPDRGTHPAARQLMAHPSTARKVSCRSLTWLVSITAACSSSSVICVGGWGAGAGARGEGAEVRFWTHTRTEHRPLHPLPDRQTRQTAGPESWLADAG